MHALIVGQTMSGKSTLARRFLAAEYLRRGFGVLVHDLHVEDWGQEAAPDRVRVYSDDAAFLSAVWRSQRCAIFVDEASELCDSRRANKGFVSIATRGRHRGHVAHFIAQNLTAIHYQVRSQCTRIYAFRLTPAECAKIVRETGYEELSALDSLPAGSFFSVLPMQRPELRRIF